MAQFKYGIIDTSDTLDNVDGAVEFLTFKPSPKVTYSEYRQPGTLCAYVVIPCINYPNTTSFCNPNPDLTYALLYVVDSSGYKFTPIE